MIDVFSGSVADLRLKYVVLTGQKMLSMRVFTDDVNELECTQLGSLPRPSHRPTGPIAALMKSAFSFCSMHAFSTSEKPASLPPIVIVRRSAEVSTPGCVIWGGSVSWNVLVMSEVTAPLHA